MNQSEREAVLRGLRDDIAEAVEQAVKGVTALGNELSGARAALGAASVATSWSAGGGQPSEDGAGGGAVTMGLDCGRTTGGVPAPASLGRQGEPAFHDGPALSGAPLGHMRGTRDGVTVNVSVVLPASSVVFLDNEMSRRRLAALLTSEIRDVLRGQRGLG